MYMFNKYNVQTQHRTKITVQKKAIKNPYDEIY